MKKLFLLLTFFLSFLNLQAKIVGKIHLSKDNKNIYLFSDVHFQDDIGQFEYLKTNVIENSERVKPLTVLIEGIKDPNFAAIRDFYLPDYRKNMFIQKLNSFVGYKRENQIEVFSIDAREKIINFYNFIFS